MPSHEHPSTLPNDSPTDLALDEQPIQLRVSDLMLSVVDLETTGVINGSSSSLCIQP